MGSFNVLMVLVVCVLCCSAYSVHRTDRFRHRPTGIAGRHHTGSPSNYGTAGYRNPTGSALDVSTANSPTGHTTGLSDNAIATDSELSIDKRQLVVTSSVENTPNHQDYFTYSRNPLKDTSDYPSYSVSEIPSTGSSEHPYRTSGSPIDYSKFIACWNLLRNKTDYPNYYYPSRDTTVNPYYTFCYNLFRGATGYRFHTSRSPSRTATGYPYYTTSRHSSRTGYPYYTTSRHSSRTGYPYYTTSRHSSRTGYPYYTTSRHSSRTGYPYYTTSRHSSRTGYPYYTTSRHSSRSTPDFSQYIFCKNLLRGTTNDPFNNLSTNPATDSSVNPYYNFCSKLISSVVYYQYHTTDYPYDTSRHHSGGTTDYPYYTSRHHSGGTTNYPYYTSRHHSGGTTDYPYDTSRHHSGGTTNYPYDTSRHHSGGTTNYPYDTSRHHSSGTTEYP